MLTGMLLHQVKAAKHIDFAAYLLPHRQRAVAQMDDRFSPFLHVQDPGIPQLA